MEELERTRKQVGVCRVLAELVSPSHRSTVDPVLVAEAETVLKEVGGMIGAAT